ncbi:NAD-dependent epimerase/dehydratase family protein [Chondrinema litorale]|uniref:NAD-dependent epimerase/dehydratase family protein n=1 Tax=Chondrinema litorale TaxID=2994555 RepID=UPI0025435EF9|nr:NAD-dependent epimerase/dehydratase family protein [Chondrinema litorale]UZR97573.1 NAD-dependent epimerase/dehydratase family protein [Chondrinema litorale]
MKVIITGATGMVGEGVLLTCLDNPQITEVLVINRKPCKVTNPKLKEIIHEDFYDVSPIENQLSGYDACFFCLGISSVGISAEDYEKITYKLTMHVAEVLAKQNPQMTFCYISGAGTDSTENGKVRWARVKGKTENDLMKLPFKAAYGVRPGFIKPIKGQKNALAFYKYVIGLFPLGRALYAKGFCKMEELANTMIYLAMHQPSKKVIEGSDIIEMAKRV